MTAPSSADTEAWHEQLVTFGFSDNGERLRGPVPWEHPASGVVTARVEVTPGEIFPFAPPRVVILDPGAPFEITFHIDRDESLCLWENDWPVDQAPWRDPQTLLRRIAGWLQNTVSGWPGDDTCDLERYLEPDHDNLVLYDATGLIPGQVVRTAAGPTRATTLVTADRRRVDNVLHGHRARGRKDKRLAWVDDIGAVERPLRSWADVAAALGGRADEVRRLIGFGMVDLILLRYSRGPTSSILALMVRRTSAGIQVSACESADTSAVTRSMRAGPAAAELADAEVAVVGCGAIGSFAADLLFRAGVRHLTLRDGERLRPGNVVRHLAGDGQVGLMKTHAVRDCLTRVDTNMDGVKSLIRPLLNLADAIALVRDHCVVLDATGNARASSLLATAVHAVGPDLGHVVVAACVQRDGDVLRVDRLPLRGGESYLPALPLLDDAAHPRERGCGSPVSPTPPGAVVAAAELAHRVVIDEATRAPAPCQRRSRRSAAPSQSHPTIGSGASHPLTRYPGTCREAVAAGRRRARQRDDGDRCRCSGSPSQGDRGTPAGMVGRLVGRRTVRGRGVRSGRHHELLEPGRTPRAGCSRRSPGRVPASLARVRRRLAQPPGCL